ncbi:ABC transporter permease [bacterium]|nr:ABC transporter permease [bacterium]
MNIIKLFQLEWMKMRNTLAWTLIFVAPSVVTLLQFFIILKMGVGDPKDGLSPWTPFFQQTMMFWSLLMLPLFITLETALLAGLEHQESHWKQILIQPVRRVEIYAAKFMAAMALMALSLIILWASILFFGFVLVWIRPAYGFQHNAIPWLSALAYLGLSLAASWFIVVIHQWVALRWRGFVAPLAFGVVMTVAGFIIIQTEYRDFYPWAMPGWLIMGFSKGDLILRPLIFGMAGGLIGSITAIWDLVRRDVV